MEFIYEILGTMFVGGIILLMFITAIQELKFRKEIHDKEMEELNLKILRVQQAITNDNKISLETLKEISNCKIVI